MLTGIVDHIDHNWSQISSLLTEKKYRVPLSYMQKALYNDLVNFTYKNNKVFITDIIVRSNELYVGLIVSKNKNKFFVNTSKHNTYTNFYIDVKDANGAKVGDIIKLSLIKWDRKYPDGKVVFILQNKEHLKNLFANNLPYNFPKNVLNEIVTNIRDEVIFHNQRIDLRHLLTFTIDPNMSKDFDDAISIEPIENGNRIGIHIVDTSAFVSEGSLLDFEAFKRGFNAYLPFKTITMLPKELTKRMSLKKKVDRCTMTLFFDLDDKNTVINFWIGESIINVQENLTYQEVDDILADSNHLWYDIFKKFSDITKHLHETIGEKRLFFNTPSYTISNNQIKKRISHNSELIVSELMIFSNKLIAEFLSKYSEIAVNRIQETPEDVKINSVISTLHKLGYVDININNFHIKLKELMVNDEKDNKVDLNIISLLLSSIQEKAKYSHLNKQHYGLDAKVYTHFTSPMRRYSDLIVHRIIKKILKHENIKVNAIFGQIYSLNKKEKYLSDIQKSLYNKNLLEFIQKNDIAFNGYIFSILNHQLNIKTEFNIDGYLLIKNKKKYKVGECIHCKIDNIEEVISGITLKLKKASK